MYMQGFIQGDTGPPQGLSKGDFSIPQLLPEKILYETLMCATCARAWANNKTHPLIGELIGLHDNIHTGTWTVLTGMCTLHTLFANLCRDIIILQCTCTCAALYLCVPCTEIYSHQAQLTDPLEYMALGYMYTRLCSLTTPRVRLTPKWSVHKAQPHPASTPNAGRHVPLATKTPGEHALHCVPYTSQVGCITNWSDAYMCIVLFQPHVVRPLS